VEVEYLTIPGLDGTPCHLRGGQALPDWVTQEQRAALIKSGAVARYQEI
jgi:hypothetical protein